MTTLTAHDIISTADLVDQLAGADLDALRALAGRLDDAQRITRAVIRERQALARRDSTWRAREAAAR